MNESKPSPAIRLRDLFLIFGAFVLVVIYLVPALNTNDALWFWPWFDAQPREIVIYYGGEVSTLRPEDADFAPIVQVVNAIVKKRNAYTTLGLSPETVERYQRQEHAIELRYEHPTRIHTPYRFGPGDAYLIPLTGRHSEYHPIFAGLRGGWLIGALRMPTTEPLIERLQSLGYW